MKNIWKILHAIVFISLAVSMFFLFKGSVTSKWFLGGSIIVWMALLAVDYRRQGTKKTIGGFVLMGVLLMVTGFLTNILAYHAEKIPDQPESQIILVGEKNLPQWESFIRGFKQGLHDLSQKEQADEPIQDDSYIGTIYIQGKSGRVAVRITEFGL